MIGRVIHENRARAASFGADAERYDRTRPRYPDAMLDDLVRGRALRVLDVGCGTGIAADAFAARGCEVLGVEPDARMAEVASRKGHRVVVTTFEEWPGDEAPFDLVVSGQAWHWVDPAVGPAKAASVLCPGGEVGLFWNLGRHDPTTQAMLDEAYRRNAPALVRDSIALGRAPMERGECDAEAIRLSGAFGEPRVRWYAWTREYTTTEWVDLLPTHSDHALLPPAVLDALLHDVAAGIDGFGGRIAVAYDTVLVTATRP